MTNETTASQPKSIGDDAQFRRLVNRFADDEGPASAWDELVAYIDSRAPAAQASATIQAAPNFQQRVQPWMMACFGAEISADKMERNHRFFEEATETVQAGGMTRSEAHQLVDYTYGRPIGELPQEVGGVMVTLAALCLAHGVDMHVAGEVELARIWTKVDKIRAKQAAKPQFSPLPEATIQEPVMVAEPDSRGLKQVPDLGQGDASTRLWLQAHGYGNVTPLHALIDLSGRVAKFTAAPMVADPAGVAVPEGYAFEVFVEYGDSRFFKPHWDKRIDLFDPRDDGKGDDPNYRNIRPVFAATVKAVPSEALELALCESAHLFLKPDQPYIFRVKSDCPECKALAQSAAPLADKTGGGE